MASESGWTNDELGFQWLTMVFDQASKNKTRNGRDWRLLFVDGHGSHVNERWLEWCEKHRVHLVIYSPHSTHRLQPLDVSLFSPLSTYYSQELDQFIQDCQCINKVSKNDFFKLFWKAYNQAFIEKNIHSDWARTDLILFDPPVVLKPFKPQDPSSQLAWPSSKSSGDSAISATSFRDIQRLIHQAVSMATGVNDR